MNQLISGKAKGQDQATDSESKQVDVNMIPSGWIFRQLNGDPANLSGLMRILAKAPEQVMDTELVRILGTYIYED